MTGRQRVEAALAMEVADRPPVGAWGHTYREEWSPEDLAAITVDQALTNGVLEHLGHAPDVLDVRLVHFGD